MPTLYNSSTYVFGTDAVSPIAGMAVESLKIDESPEFEAEAKDQTGSVVSYVVGDAKKNFTASGFLTTATFDIEDFTYDGLTFIIESRSITESNSDFKKCELSGVAYAVIGATAGSAV